MRQSRWNYRLIGLFVALLVLAILTSLALAQGESDIDEASRPLGGTYTIEVGDILDVLGQRWDVSVVALKQANDIGPFTILRPGDKIIVPVDAPHYGEYPPIFNTATQDTSLGRGGGGSSYVVQIADTLDQIGQRLDVSVAAMQQANDITNPRKLMAGTILLIPLNAPAYGLFPARTDTTGDSGPGSGGGASGPTHVVQRNQTLDGIAADYNVQVNCLAEANGLTNPRKLFVGDVIVIDDSCPAYDGYDFVGPRPGSDEG